MDGRNTYENKGYTFDFETASIHFDVCLVDDVVEVTKSYDESSHLS